LAKVKVRFFSSLLVFALVLSLAPAAVSANRAPSLKLEDLNGQTVKLSSLRGHIVVLSFWATWCAPCQEELPRLSTISKSYASKDVLFIAVSIDDKKDVPKIQPFLAKHSIALDVWTGASADTLGRFGLGDIVPGTIILDEQGDAITRIMGEAREGDIRSAVDWLLNQRTGPAPAPMLRRY
jgi:thiol-disulfide isomerase/thioredoxin